MLKSVLKHALKIVFTLVIIVVVIDIMMSANLDQIWSGIWLCFYLISILTISYLIYGLFTNISYKKLLVAFCCYMIFVLIVPMKPTYEQYDCISDAICKEGLEINTEYGLIKVNKENCLKYNWIWNDKSKTCDMKN